VRLSADTVMKMDVTFLAKRRLFWERLGYIVDQTGERMVEVLVGSRRTVFRQALAYLLSRDGISVAQTARVASLDGWTGVKVALLEVEPDAGWREWAAALRGARPETRLVLLVEPGAPGEARGVPELDGVCVLPLSSSLATILRAARP
jgi:hypothetical protein